MERDVKIEVLVYLIIIVFCLVCTILAYYIFFQKELLCVGGVPEGACSSVNPYYCLKGNLVKDVLKCGCPASSKVQNKDCFSIYQTSPKEVFLPYTLRGKEGVINFTVYEGVYKYILNISRYIKSSENPTLLDFRLKNINDSIQRDFLFPLVFAIQNITTNREDQVRIAVSLVQNIPYGISDKSNTFSKLMGMDYQRYAYEVLYENEGVCGEKSSLLIFLLKELGYGTSFLYYKEENHEAVGLKCSSKGSMASTDYCFIETTGPSIISDDKNEFVGIGYLSSNPDLIIISEGKSFGRKRYEYKDADKLLGIRETMQEYGAINFIQTIQFRNLKKKYGLISYNSYEF